jgi:2-keto-4-pentenoate hydratase/2-oxohepta-3-ene-1,7-dioic acid hydratase in catechol pathway
MRSPTRPIHPSLLLPALFLSLAQPLSAQGNVTLYVRYAVGDAVSYGILEGDRIRQLEGDLFASPRPTGQSVPLADVRLLAPVEPSKVIAVGRNFRSHLGDRPAPEWPGLFAKYPTSIIGPGDSIVLPPDANNAHYEGELVLVIGRRAKDVPRERALEYVFGVTAGNDISERDWQAGDLQWFRAKATDTFAPIGPVIARGLDPDNLLIQTRVNGEVRQSERSADLLFDVSEIISYVSRYVTLVPGDVIFTGTPQTTRALSPGDVVEIEIEGVGVLRNPVVRASR